MVRSVFLFVFGRGVATGGTCEPGNTTDWATLIVFLLILNVIARISVSTGPARFLSLSLRTDATVEGGAHFWRKRAVHVSVRSVGAEVCLPTPKCVG